MESVLFAALAVAVAFSHRRPAYDRLSGRDAGNDFRMGFLENSWHLFR
jgi:hypothetical protein